MWPFNKNSEDTPLPRYKDILDIMRYLPPNNVAKETFLPTIYGLRPKEGIPALDGFPEFALLETEDEVKGWHEMLTTLVERDAKGFMTIEPLMKWNYIPSLLTDIDNFWGCYLPEDENTNWPLLGLKTFKPEDELPADHPPLGRDRYLYEETNTYFAIL